MLAKRKGATESDKTNMKRKKEVFSAGTPGQGTTTILCNLALFGLVSDINVVSTNKNMSFVF